MLQFGLLTPEQYSRATKKRRMAGSGVAFTLLETGGPPTKDEIQRFEEISYSLRTSNGTTRMTFHNRMPDVDEVALRLLRQIYLPDAHLVVQDRAASTCLTSMEWAQQLLPIYRQMQFEASDLLLYLLRVSLPNGATYILEPSGQPLQYIKSPFVVCLCPREPLRYPVNQFVAALAKRRVRGLSLPKSPSETEGNTLYRIDKISCVHPEARALSARDSRFIIRARSVFDNTSDIDVLRTMNILNLAYFPTDRLLEGVRAAYSSVKPGGLWIVGRTHEQDAKNHVTFFRRTDTGWEALAKIGNGSEIEHLVISGAGPFGNRD
jgi:hypothetical protein